MSFKILKKRLVTATEILFLSGLFGGFLIGCGKLSGVSNSSTTSGGQTFAMLSNTTTYASGLTVDSSGNIYVAGNTTANFLPCQIGSPCSTGSQGITDYFITKYTSQGSRLWTQQLGQTGTFTSVDTVVTDSSSNVYVAGTTNGNLESCNGSSSACSGTFSGGYFISKYTSNGNWIWTRQLANYGVTAMAIDTSSNVYVFGKTNDSYFISKYNSMGTSIWTTQLSESGQSTEVYGGAVDSSGNAYIMGVTTGNLTSCGGVSSACSGNAQGIEDYYISKYTSGGDWVWTKQLGETSQSTEGLSVTVDASSNIYLTGRSTGNLVSCNGVSSSCSGAAQGRWDYFISKYTSGGTWSWTKQLGESGTSTTASGTTVDASSNIYVTGYTTANLTSCNGVSSSCSGSSQGVYDYFISKYASDGTWGWTKQLGETGLMALGSEIFIDPSANLYLTGDTTGNLTSCNGVSSSCSGNAQGTQDYFISKYTTGGSWVSTNQF